MILIINLMVKKVGKGKGDSGKDEEDMKIFAKTLSFGTKVLKGKSSTSINQLLNQAASQEHRQRVHRVRCGADGRV